MRAKLGLQQLLKRKGQDGPDTYPPKRQPRYGKKKEPAFVMAGSLPFNKRYSFVLVGISCLRGGYQG